MILRISSPETRGLLASTFKRLQTSTLIASYEAMGRGYSFENCAHLIAAAFDTFRNSGPRTEETILEAAWPSMRKRLSRSQQRFREWHPPQVGPKVTVAELALAREGIAPHALFDFALAKERLRQKLLNPPNPSNDPPHHRP